LITFCFPCWSTEAGRTPYRSRWSARWRSCTGLSDSKNSEIACKWLQLRLGAGDTEAFEPTAKALAAAGRMKFLRPLYRSLRRSGKEGEAFALKTFEETRAMYHPIAEKMVAADLGV
jgi:leukotriene-A4 hydrolase